MTVKKKLLLLKNIDSSGRLFKHISLFTASEIYNLEWDGLGMIENWRTKRINGYVTDYAFKDADNDGQPEIVLALVLSAGISLKNKSVIVVYELRPPILNNLLTNIALLDIASRKSMLPPSWADLITNHHRRCSSAG